MEQIPDYGDQRTLHYCAFCGGETGTRDHCPSRIFLDFPYPENLPVVPACSKCNNSFSADEEYFACLLSCVVAGSTEPEVIQRPKIRKILLRKPALRARIEQSRALSLFNETAFPPELNRIISIVTKLAKGHALFELHENVCHSPDIIECIPLSQMNDKQRVCFENPESVEAWPEVGSRTMIRLIEESDYSVGGWLNVQPERYRYHTCIGNDGIEVRIVLNEYLACYVCWS